MWGEISLWFVIVVIVIVLAWFALKLIKRK